MKFILAVLILLSPLTSNATDCKEAVILLEAGKPAPCTGFLFSPEAERKASQAVDDAKYYKELSELLHSKNTLLLSEIRIQDERLALYMKSTYELAEEVNRKRNEDFWQKTAYFGLGVLTTSLSVYAAAQFNR